VQDQRDARYNLLRGYFHGADDDTVNERDQERLSTVTLPPGAKVMGSRWVGWRCPPWACAWSTCGGATATRVPPWTKRCWRRGDTLVLSGHPAALALAEDKLLRGTSP
jgi:CPA2 family monovalent cation:H+ antiporter-2